MADISIHLDDLVDRSLAKRTQGLKQVEDVRVTEEETLDRMLDLAYEVVQHPGHQPDDALTDQEVQVIMGADRKLLAASVQGKDDLAKAIWARLKRVYLRQRVAAAKNIAAQQPGYGQFKPPPLRFPDLAWENPGGSRTMQDTIQFCRWKNSIKQTRRLARCSDTTALEVVRDKVPESLKSRVLNTMTLSDLFAIAEGELPPVNTVAEDIERQLKAGPLWSQESPVTPQMVEKYARKILKLLEDQACIAPMMDCPFRVVQSVVESFPVAYSGSFMKKREELAGWKNRYETEQILLVTQLREWLESIKSDAATQAQRESSYGPQWTKTPKKEKEPDVTKRIMALEAQVREEGRGGSGRQRAQRGEELCYTCEKTGHVTAKCGVVREIRDEGKTPPKGLCLLCLRMEKPGQRHFIDEKVGCHIGPATLRKQREREDKGLKRDYLCYKHKVALPVCRPCYVSTDGKKANEVPLPKYIGSK